MLDGYTVLKNGVIRQTGWFVAPKVYDVNYIRERYETYGEKNEQMSEVRFNNIVKVIGKVPKTILDIGYGNGSFLKYASKFCETYGSDISGYPIPEGSKFVDKIDDKEYDVVCMFDVLEHFTDPTEVKKIKTKYLAISVPWCHYEKHGDNWFRGWKHRRPDEHLWHFNSLSLPKFLEPFGYELLDFSNVEDQIRQSTLPDPNILTAIFEKVAC